MSGRGFMFGWCLFCAVNGTARAVLDFAMGRDASILVGAICMGGYLGLGLTLFSAARPSTKEGALDSSIVLPAPEKGGETGDGQ